MQRYAAFDGIVAVVNNLLKGDSVMELSVLGIDLAKSVFQLHGVDARGKAVLNRRLTRRTLLRYVAQLPRCTIAMETCISAHYWARRFQELGHDVQLISPQFVKPSLGLSAGAPTVANPRNVKSGTTDQGERGKDILGTHLHERWLTRSRSIK